MFIHTTQPLFAWAELEDSPSLVTLRAVLESLPDQHLLDGLQQARGHGHDGYPLRVLGGVTLVAVLCRHVWLNDGLAELHRNPTLCAAEEILGSGRRERGGDAAVPCAPGHRVGCQRQPRCPGADTPGRPGITP